MWTGKGVKIKIEYLGFEGIESWEKIDAEEMFEDILT